MGACASKFNVFKDDADAPPPAPKEEMVSREVNLAEEVVKKEDEPAVAADSEETKSPSLGHLLKENEEVKQEDATDAKPQETGNVTEKAPATDHGLKPENSEEKKAEDVKPASQLVEVEASQTKTEEKPSETTKIESLEKVETKKTEENKPDEKSGTDKKPEVPETENKKIEEKKSETTKTETPETKKIEVEKTVSDAEKKKTDENTKIETLTKIEDKQVVEPPKIESPLEKKPDEKSVTDKKPETPEIKTEEQKPVLDAEKAKTGEDKTKK
ncbi:hypothetical protein DH2020_047851 [Rehmannia glutinosa]|uniref:Uncharacterized protein n=1 Tax=Rehmannia glutinosa TaxID=99300 RepID=A0ABR0U7E4_REHGL